MDKARFSVLRTALHWRIQNLRFAFLLIAVGIYALWGTPTPESAGWPEIGTGLFLVLAIGVPGIVTTFDTSRGLPWQQTARVFLFYGLSIPVFAALLDGNSLKAMLRDIVPFLFLFLPLFLSPTCSIANSEDSRDKVKWLTGFVSILGVIFSLRVLAPYMMSNVNVNVIDPFLLANAPTVLFAALLLIGLCGHKLYHNDFLSSILLLLLAIVPLMAMGLIIQRASIGAVLIAVTVLALIGFYRRPARLFVPLVFVLITISVYLPFIKDLGETLIHKNELVGFNMRWQEILAVIDVVDDSIYTTLFGRGWGAQILSPAAGGIVVNFTHNIFTTYWLKTGLLGTVLLALYLYQMGHMILRLIFRNPVIAIALAGPFLIDILLYASFKSLDFGFILLLIPLWAGASGILQKNKTYSI